MTLAVVVRIMTGGKIAMASDLCTQRFVVCTGDGDRFDVIVGHKLNEDPLSLADANRLARRASASVVSVAGNLVSETRP
jgi:hypothetical protein